MAVTLDNRKSNNRKSDTEWRPRCMVCGWQGRWEPFREWAQESVAEHKCPVDQEIK